MSRNNQMTNVDTIISHIKNLLKLENIMTSRKMKFYYILCLVFCVFFGKSVISGLKNAMENVNIVVPDVEIAIPEPSVTNKTLVEGLSDVVTDKKDRIQLRDFFATLAHVIDTDPNLIKTTSDFKEYNSLSGQLNFTGLDLKDKYNDLGEAIDKVIVSTLGLENVNMTPEKRKVLVDVLNAVAWSFNQ